MGSTTQSVLSIVADATRHNSDVINLTQGLGAEHGNSSWRGDLSDLPLDAYSDPCSLDNSPQLGHVMSFPTRHGNQRSTEDQLPTVANSTNSTQHCEFILMAPTSAVVPFDEESVTFVNQNQSYEVKCIRRNHQYLGTARTMFRTIVSLEFHNRKQRYEANELLNSWHKDHPGVEPLEIDLPQSLNISDVETSGTSIEFTWTTSERTSLFIKFRLLSTDFTEGRQGGKKGVPFRLVIRTFPCDGAVRGKQLHAAYAQIRIFRLRGADRKNKFDRDKAQQRHDTERFQPAYDYTILTEPYPLDTSGMEGEGETRTAVQRHIDSGTIQKSACNKSGPRQEGSYKCATAELLPPDANWQTIKNWLKSNGYGGEIKTFENFSLNDLLLLSREDISDLADTPANGIRLYNSLRVTRAVPRKTLFARMRESKEPFQPLYLLAVTRAELKEQLQRACLIPQSNWEKMTFEGPAGIPVSITDDVVAQWPENAVFLIEKASNSSGIHLHLKTNQ